jgi:fatty-acyl-CoA synthase
VSALSWREFIARAPPGKAMTDAPERAAALFHTGGSTGAPKLAELSQWNLAAGALMSAAATALRAEDRILCGLPLFHVGGAIDIVLGAISVGATLIFPTVLGARDPQVMRRIWSLVDETQATILSLVPTSLATAASVSRAGAHLRSLRVVATGGSSCAPQLVGRIEAASGRAVAQVYGMTEASGIIAAQPFDGVFRPSAVGFAAPLVKLRIGPAGEGSSSLPHGEVQWQGPNRFIGYRTVEASMHCADEWIASGDLAETGADGQLHLLGRMKDVIIRSGHNIDPLLIEDTAQAHPDVRLAAAVPIPDAYAGELPVLYVSLQDGATCTPQDIARFIAERIAEPPARPARVLILPELPLTPFGKVARYRLRQQAALLRAHEALAGLAIESVSCTDPVAKRIEVDWRAQASPEERARGIAILGELGLTLAQV